MAEENTAPERTETLVLKMTAEHRAALQCIATSLQYSVEQLVEVLLDPDRILSSLGIEAEFEKVDVH